MDIPLTPELEEFINQKLADGVYRNANELVIDALSVFQERHLALIEQHRELVREGFADIENGDFEEYDETTRHELVADIVTRGRARLAESGKTLEDEIVSPRA